LPIPPSPGWARWKARISREAAPRELITSTRSGRLPGRTEAAGEQADAVLGVRSIATIAELAYTACA